jgi:histone acetyltransferase (RNA polymerase elongator complex component)
VLPPLATIHHVWHDKPNAAAHTSTPAGVLENGSRKGTEMRQRTIEQQIAEAEARLARLRTQSRQLENGQKIILGGMLLAAARHDPKIRAWLIKEAGKAVKREIDKKRLEPLLEELRAMKDEKTGESAGVHEQATFGGL